MSTKAYKQEFPDIFAEKSIGTAKSLFSATCQHQWQHKCTIMHHRKSHTAPYYIPLLLAIQLTPWNIKLKKYTKN
jgi:hypothetical protein